MSLKNVGDALRQERMRQGLSLADVAGISKISPHTLEALEEGDMSTMPHHVYLKGFVKTYASILKIDARKLGEQVDEAFAELGMDIPEPSPLMSQPYITPDTRPRPSGGRLLLSLLLLAAVGLAVWGGIAFFFPDLSGDVGANAVSGGGRDADARQSLVFPGSEDQAEGDRSDYAALPDQAPAEDNATGEMETPPTDPGMEPEEAIRDASRAGHLLEITAVNDCWLRAVVDGVNATEALLYAGESMDLDFSRSLEVKFGNVAGVELRYDGEILSVNATEGTAKTLSFPPDQ